MQSRFLGYVFLALGLLGSGAMACGGEFLPNGGVLSSSNSSNIATVEIKNCPTSPRPALSEEPFLIEVKDANGSVISSASLNFQSTRPDIARVSNNLLKTFYPGQTSVTASSGGMISAPCDITVLPPSNSRSVLQLTNNLEDDSWGQNNNASTTSRGRILWQHINQNGDAEVLLGDGNGNASLLKTVANAGDVDFMALGSGAGANDVLASWRENLSTTFVSDGNGNSSSLGMQTQEENSISDGCLFFRKGLPENDIIRYSSSNGVDPISTAGELFNPITSGCQAVYELQQNGMSSLIYFDGANETPFAGGLPLFPRFDFREGKAVYAMGGDIFLYDTTAANPQVINLTKQPAALNNFPKTDGHSVVFTRNNGGVYDVVLYEIASGHLHVISTTTDPKEGNSLHIDLKQVIWLEGGNLYFYDGNTTALVDPFPGTAIFQPHLSDGLVTWFGPTGAFSDNEIFLLK